VIVRARVVPESARVCSVGFAPITPDWDRCEASCLVGCADK